MTQSALAVKTEPKTEIRYLTILKKLKKQKNYELDNKFLDEVFCEENEVYLKKFNLFLIDLENYAFYIAKDTLHSHSKIKAVLSLYQAQMFDMLEEKTPSVYQLNSKTLLQLGEQIEAYNQFLMKMNQIFKPYNLDSYYHQREAYLFKKIFALLPSIYHLCEKNRNLMPIYDLIYRVIRPNYSIIGKH